MKKNENNENDILKQNEDEDVYYELLSSFYLSELKRESDINYRASILEQILINDKIIIKSLESFKILLKSILQPEIDKFEKILTTLTFKSDDIILEMIEKKDSIALNDSLLYLFEKNSFIYFEKAEIVDKNIMEKKFNTFYKKKRAIHLINDEPLSIFEDCIKYLESSLIKEDSKSKYKKMKKLFCLAYIRVFIYKFIHILKEDHTGFDEKKIISAINGEKGTKLREMIKLYLYKVVFNINGNDKNSLKSERFKLKKFYRF